MKQIAAVLLTAAWIFSAIPTADTVTNYKGIQFKRIPAGTFEMGFEGRTLTGSACFNGVDQGFYNEYPRHKVTLTQDFYMSVCEINRHQYVPTDGSTKPMGWLTWAAAGAFCDTMTAHDPNGWTYRLPTEAEWEYCCRAGTSTWFWTGDTLLGSQALMWGDVVPVGSYAPNPFGLYDMIGNVEEWCLDWYGLYPPQGDSLVNPGGPADGKLKCIRSFRNAYGRSVARGALPPVLSADGIKGFRVVISNLTKDSLNYYPNPDTLPKDYQKRVMQGRPAPLTAVAGETYTDADGLSFTRVRMTRAGYPMQKDSVVYVSQAPIDNDSAAGRVLAGLFAVRLSATYGLLYRISNPYELACAGIADPQGFYLTILPDIKYAAGQPHPDKCYYQARRSGTIPTPSPYIGGPVFYEVNHNSFIGECPNGDLIASWYSGTTEDNVEQVTAGNRLRLGENQWDSLASQIVDFPAYSDYQEVWHDNGKGVLYDYHTTTSGLNGTWLRKSPDNGVTWSDWVFTGVNIGKSIFRLGGDSLADVSEGAALAVSSDNGEHWGWSGTSVGGGYHASGAVLDDGAIIAFKRGATVVNDSGVATMWSGRTATLGQTWTQLASPFFPADIGQYDVCLKLQSGRLLMASVCKTAGKGGVVLIESVDSGKSWFCRRKLDGNHGTPLFEGGYKDMCQGRDGVIHLQGTIGSGGGTNARLPQASFSEEWLREGVCLDITEWGIRTTGMVAECPDEDTLRTDLAGSVGASLVGAPTLAAVPNPFNPSTTIIANLPGNQGAELSVYSIAGKAIRHWDLKAGNHRISWNGRDAAGKVIPSGCYFLVMKTSDDNRLIERVVLLK